MTPLPRRRLVATGFELRLHEQHEISPGRAQREETGEHRSERDEGEVGDQHVHGLADGGDGEVAHVCAFPHVDSRISAKPLVELAVADIHRDHRRRADLQQAVREAARGGAGVERTPSRDVDVERRERGGQLLSPAAHEARWIAEHHDGFVDRNES